MVMKTLLRIRKRKTEESFSIFQCKIIGSHMWQNFFT